MKVSADARRLAERFHQTWQMLTPRELMIADREWSEVDVTYRRQLEQTFEEMIRGEVLFAGPSLYADP